MQVRQPRNCLGVSFAFMTLSIWLCWHAAMRAQAGDTSAMFPGLDHLAKGKRQDDSRQVSNWKQSTTGSILVYFMF